MKVAKTELAGKSGGSSATQTCPHCGGNHPGAAHWDAVIALDVLDGLLLPCSPVVRAWARVLRGLLMVDPSWPA
jgi:hypothetical protein